MDISAQIFKSLDNLNIKYVVLRDVDNALPLKITSEKDIDLLVLESDYKKLNNLQKEGWVETQHPFRNSVFLYGLKKFRMFTFSGIPVDFTTKLCVRSLNKGEWMPLDQSIQDTIFERSVESSFSTSVRTLGPEHELLHLVSRSIFDKNLFLPSYTARINELEYVFNSPIFREMLLTVFFKFTDCLIENLKKRKLEKIYDLYIKFDRY
jgi:hypothetical protein